MSTPKCRKCGSDPDHISVRGAWLERMNKGQTPSIWGCAPSCEHHHGDEIDALMGAIEGPQETER